MVGRSQVGVKSGARWIEGHRPGGVAGARVLLGDERVAAGERLGRPGELPWVLRDRALLDALHGLAGGAVEDVEHARLAAVDDDLASCRRFPGRQHRRHRVVAVPQVVVDRLEVPAAGPGLGVERDQGVGEQVGPVPGGPVGARIRVAERPVHGAEVRVDRRVDPGHGAARLPGRARPGVVAVLAAPGSSRTSTRSRRWPRPARRRGPARRTRCRSCRCRPARRSRWPRRRGPRARDRAAAR